MELRPKYFRRRKKIILPEAPHIESPNKWLHYAGVHVTNDHHAKSRSYGTIEVYWEELNNYEKIGYATNSWSYIRMTNRNRKDGHIWLRTPIFFIWVYSPFLQSININSGDIYASYAHLYKNPYRLVINGHANRYYYPPIMVQVGKRIVQMRERELFD